MGEAMAGNFRERGAQGNGADSAGEKCPEESWALPADLGLHFRRLGHRVAVFNEETADTHLLEPWAAMILERLDRGPATVSELLEIVGTEPGGGGAAMVGALEEFRYLGLIESLPNCS